MFLDLCVERRHHALQTPQSVEELCILRLSTLPRSAPGSWKDAFDFGAQAVGARVFLVALDLQRGTHTSVDVGKMATWRSSDRQRTFRRRHVTHDRGFGVGAPATEPPLEPFPAWAGSGEYSACGESSDMVLLCLSTTY
jgi:hypothetical protein